MFLAGCAGVVLLGTLDDAFVVTASAVLPIKDSEAVVRLSVVMLAIAFSGIVFKSSIKGFKQVVNWILVILLALMLWQQLPSVVGADWLVAATKDSWWGVINDYQTLIVATGLLLSLFMIMPKEKEKHKKSKHD